MTIEAEAGPVGGEEREPGTRFDRLRRTGRTLVSRLSSTLSRRIIVVNLIGLAMLMLGYLYLNQFRAGLIEGRIQSLVVQGEIIASAIASSATVERDTIRIDPDKLLQLQAGEAGRPTDEPDGPLSFSINPAQIAPLLTRLVIPTKTRARVFDSGAVLVLDSRDLFWGVEGLGGPPSPPKSEDLTIIERTWSLFRNRFGKTEIQLGEDFSSPDGRNFPEVTRALRGTSGSAARVNQRGQTIVSVAVPIRHSQVVRGVLFLSTEGGDIDAIIAGERWSIVSIFLVAAAVMSVVSYMLAGTIAEPMRRLAESAERVRHGDVNARAEIPDLTSRADEIGHLSGALRDMTKALFSRMEATERFAADVAHELKNPLTSLRSAVETWPLARTDASRERLLAVIRHDVMRLDRLISDISDASRVDAEMARHEAEPVDLTRLAETVIAVQNDSRRGGVPIRFVNASPGDSIQVMGHDSRLGRVLTNLLDNARSFSPPDGTVTVTISRKDRFAELRVDDDGPGVPEHALERIFERFYTDRPEAGFGENSGLGLSISRQIVEGHGGRVWAENWLGDPDPDGTRPVRGARFVLRLPMAPA